MGWMGDRFFGWIWILKNQRLGAGFEVQFFWISGFGLFGGIWVLGRGYWLRACHADSNTLAHRF